MRATGLRLVRPHAIFSLAVSEADILGNNGMVRYRRNFLPGGTCFFTVTLSDRRSTALVDHVAALRNGFRAARRVRPFAVQAIVILPDHLHAIFTLPPDDADFSGRWR